MQSSVEKDHGEEKSDKGEEGVRRNKECSKVRQVKCDIWAHSGDPLTGKATGAEAVRTAAYEAAASCAAQAGIAGRKGAVIGKTGRF